MAVGFPVKDDYATGDVLTAANMNDLSGTLNTVPTLAGNVNPVLNSSFQLWQRGTSIAQTAAIMYGADRWCSNRGGLDTGSTISRQVTGDTTNLPNIQYCARVQRNNANASTNIIYFSQTIESLNSIPYAGKTITFSFYARKGANYSSASDALSITVSSGTGTDQNILSTYTGAASAIGGTQTATLTATWQRFTYTGTVAATATELGFYFNYTPVGTAGAADYFEVTGVQIDVGSVALPFRTYAATIQGELDACMRYYERFTSTAAYGLIGTGKAYSTGAINIQMPFKVTKRVTPTAVDTSAMATFQFETGGTAGNTPTAIINNTGVTTPSYGQAEIQKTTTFTTGAYYFLMGNNSTNAFIGWSAEL
jgi:hypothetical protein